MGMVLIKFLSFEGKLRIEWLCYWVRVSEPHTSALNVEFCLYGTYVHRSVRHDRPSRLNWSLLSLTVTATTCAYCPAPFRLLHGASMSNSETTHEQC